MRFGIYIKIPKITKYDLNIFFNLIGHKTFQNPKTKIKIPNTL